MKTTPTTEARSVTTPELKYNEPLFKKLFFGSLVLMLALFWVFGYDSGVNTDEMDINVYSKANVAYYTSGLKDTTFLHAAHADGVKLAGTLPSYGSGFEYIVIAVNKLTGNSNGYGFITAHMVTQFFAVLGLMFTGLTAKRLRNYKAALIAIWMMFLTPTFMGFAVFDTKDIPFLTGYIASIYFILGFFSELPSPRWKTVICLMLSLWFVMSVRIGAVILFSYIALFGIIYLIQNKTLLQHVKDWGVKLAVIIAGAFLLTILIWPFVLRDPANLFRSLQMMSKFPQRIPLIFEGEYIDSLTLPTYYLFKNFFITVPIVLLAVLVLGLVYLVYTRKQQKQKLLLLVVFAGIFPIAYATYAHMYVYNGWRHVLFIYAPLMAAAGVAVATFLDAVRKPAIQWGTVAVIAIGLVAPTRWVIKNLPLDRAYTYYNESVGGFKGAYNVYETEYWMMTVKDAIDWLFANDPAFKKGSTEPVVIASNDYNFVRYYIEKRYPGHPNVKGVQCGVRSNFGVKWNYGIFHSLFLEPTFMETCFPHPLSVHTVDIDGLPTTEVVRDNDRFDYQAFQAFNANNFPKADSFFNLYFTKTKFDPKGDRNITPLIGMAAFTRLALGDVNTAKMLARITLNRYPADYVANLSMGVALLQSQDIENGRKFLVNAQNVNPQDVIAKQYLAQITARH